MSKILKRTFASAAILAILIGGADYGWHYWSEGRFLEATDDAYLQADYTTIAPKVTGYLAEVLVEDNQPVAAGEVLARIDDRDFRAALEQANADVSSAEADIQNLNAQIAEQQSAIEQADAATVADQATLTFAEQEAQRYRDLAARGSGTVQSAQRTQATLQQQDAALQRDRAVLAAAHKHNDVLKTALVKATTVLRRMRAVEEQAALNLGYTTIKSPVAGSVGARTLRVGQYVQAATQLMAIVPLNKMYVIGNFKETQLTNVQAGQQVEITVDSFRGETLKGHVDSLAPASGLTFALLPPDNATGNFTKIVQRIPVKIALDRDQPLLDRLRPGMSVEPTVDTKAAVLASRATPASPSTPVTAMAAR
ncbi:MAG TPA: HlyD family secretion protein [Pseudolabrys sp.]|nr:HlyD family secretion protein [Pseudolabrys sp.]